MPETQQVPPQSEVVAKSYAVSPEAPKTGEREAGEALARRLQRTYNQSKESDPLAALKHKKEAGILERTDTETPLKKHLETPEQLDRARKTVDLVRDLEERGYDGLDNDDQRADLKKIVLDKVIGGREAFDGLSTEEKDLMAESMLQNPETVGKMADTLKQRIEHPKVDEEVENSIKAAKEKVEATQSEIDGNKKEISRAGREITRAKTREQQIKERLEEIGGDKNDNIEQRNEVQAKLKQKFSEAEKFDELQRAVEGKIARGEDVSGEDEANMKDYIDLQKKLGEYRQLEDEQASIPGKIDQLKEKQTELRITNRELAHKKASQEGDLNDALAKRGTQSEQFVTDLEYSLADGANDWLDEDVEKRVAASKQKLEEEAKASASEDEQRTIDSLTKRLYKVEEKKGRIKLKMDKRKIRKSANELIQKGREGITKEMMMEQFVEKANDSDEVKAQKAQERARIEQRLATDDEFAKKMQNKVAQEILAARMKVGPLYEGEVFLLQQKDWGEDAVKGAVDSNADIRQKVDEVWSQTGPASAYERMRDNMGWTNKNVAIKSVAAIMSAIAVPLGIDKIIKWRMNRNEMGRRHPQG